jgi:uncharacterized membrane protein
MLFLAILLLATAAAGVLGRTRGPRTWARVGLGLALVVAGIAHLVEPLPFEQHLPGWVPLTAGLVLVTGLLEIALGLALVLARPYRRRVGQVTAVYLLAVWPANLYVAAAGVDVDGQPGGPYAWIRVPLQVLFILWALWSTAEPAPACDDETAPARSGDPTPAERTLAG